MKVWGPYSLQPKHVRLSVEEVCLKHGIAIETITVVVIVHPQYVEVWQKRALFSFHLDAILGVLEQKNLVLPSEHRYAIWETEEQLDIPDRVRLVISGINNKRVLIIDEC